MCNNLNRNIQNAATISLNIDSQHSSIAEFLHEDISCWFVLVFVNRCAVLLAFYLNL